MSLRDLKDRKGPFFCLMLLLFFSLGCGDDRKASIGEPNDSILDAGMLEKGRAIEMRIDSSGDRDWYALALDTNSYVKLGTQKVPEPLRLEVRFAKKQAWEKEKKQWSSDWKEIPTLHSPGKKDTLYFVVRSKGERAHEKAFKLRAESLEKMDAHEPNDAKEEAKDVELEKEYRSYVFPKGDRDHFRLKVEQEGYLYAEAKGVPEEIGAELRFLRMDRGEGRLRPISGYREFPAGVAINEPDTYYLELGDDHNDAKSRKPIEWSVEFVPQMDSTEPNVRWKESQPVQAGSELQVALFPTGDRDHFSISPRTSMELEVTVDGADVITPQMQLVVNGEEGHKNLTDWLTLPASFEMEGGQEYSLVLREKGDDGAHREPFILRFQK